MTPKQREIFEGIAHDLQIPVNERGGMASLNVGSTVRREVVIAAWKYILELESRVAPPLELQLADHGKVVYDDKGRLIESDHF